MIYLDSIIPAHPFPTYSDFPNISDSVFDDLTVINYQGRSAGKPSISQWLCRCVCGQLVIVAANALRTGHTKSCGCRRVRFPSGSKHNLCRIPEYGVWAAMKRRCLNTSVREYKDYGGRGIQVCNEWLHFINFWNDMGPRPTPAHTLERMNNSDNYCPENCIWATRSVQANNKRSTHCITFQGRTQTLRAWSRELNITRDALYQRIFAYKWSVEKTLTTPPQKNQFG